MSPDAPAARLPHCPALMDSAIWGLISSGELSIPGLNVPSSPPTRMSGASAKPGGSGTENHSAMRWAQLLSRQQPSEQRTVLSCASRCLCFFWHLAGTAICHCVGNQVDMDEEAAHRRLIMGFVLGLALAQLRGYRR